MECRVSPRVADGLEVPFITPEEGHNPEERSSLLGVVQGVLNRLFMQRLAGTRDTRLLWLLHRQH